MRAVPRARAISELARADEAARARARSLLASCLLVTRSDRYEIDTFYGEAGLGGGKINRVVAEVSAGSDGLAGASSSLSDSESE